MTALTGTQFDIDDGRRLMDDSSTDHADGWIIFLAGLLMAVGVAMVFSASMDVKGPPIDLRRWWNTPLRQGGFALLGFVVMLLTASIGHEVWRWDGRRRLVGPLGLTIFAVLLLVAVLIPGIGTTSLGARRAFVIDAAGASISFQPSELAKVVIVVWLAALLSRPGFDIRSVRFGLLPAIGSAGLLIGLTGIEDFGTAALMGVVTFFLLVFARANWLHLFGLILLGAGAGAGLVWMKPYRWDRIEAFLAGNPDPAREGYQVTQSLIAIGSGGWWGRGLGQGIQKYGYIPHDDNDFIFAVICEELGIVGGLAIIALFLMFLLRGFWLGRRAGLGRSGSPPDAFARLLAWGLTLMICLQAVFNIAVVTKSVPTKGISLPFVSAGGSGVLFLSIAAGLIAAVGRRREAPQSPKFLSQ